MAVDSIGSRMEQSIQHPASPPQFKPSALPIGRGEQDAAPTPKVLTPKSVSINFDPAKAHQDLQTAMKLLNEQMASTSRGLGFSYDSSKQSAVIKVTDLGSGEVVRQIPSEEVLRVAHKLDELKGILFNKVG